MGRMSGHVAGIAIPQSWINSQQHDSALITRDYLTRGTSRTRLALHYEIERRSHHYRNDLRNHRRRGCAPRHFPWIDLGPFIFLENWLAGRTLLERDGKQRVVATSLGMRRWRDPPNTENGVREQPVSPLLEG
jgi:hypothetical protein